MLKSKEIYFTDNKSKSDHVFLNTKSNNKYSPIEGLHGVYMIYYKHELIYIGSATGKDGIKSRIGNHFTHRNGEVHIQKYLMKKDKIDKNDLKEFKKMMIEKGKIIIYYFESEKETLDKRIKTKISKFESFCINYANPPCNNLKRQILFPREWFELVMKDFDAIKNNTDIIKSTP